MLFTTSTLFTLTFAARFGQQSPFNDRISFVVEPTARARANQAKSAGLGAEGSAPRVVGTTDAVELEDSTMLQLHAEVNTEDGGSTQEGLEQPALIEFRPKPCTDFYLECSLNDFSGVSKITFRVCISKAVLDGFGWGCDKFKYEPASRMSLVRVVAFARDISKGIKQGSLGLCKGNKCHASCFPKKERAGAQVCEDSEEHEAEGGWSMFRILNSASCETACTSIQCPNIRRLSGELLQLHENFRRDQFRTDSHVVCLYETMGTDDFGSKTITNNVPRCNGEAKTFICLPQ